MYKQKTRAWIYFNTWCTRFWRAKARWGAKHSPLLNIYYYFAGVITKLMCIAIIKLADQNPGEVCNLFVSTYISDIPKSKFCNYPECGGNGNMVPGRFDFFKCCFLEPLQFLVCKNVWKTNEQADSATRKKGCLSAHLAADSLTSPTSENESILWLLSNDVFE